LCYAIENENPGKIILSDIIKKQKPLPVEKKKGGTLFSQEKIPNYRNRKNLSDTVLFKKNTNDLKSTHLGCTPVLHLSNGYYFTVLYLQTRGKGLPRKARKD
jgi:hypothetical protein